MLLLVQYIESKCEHYAGSIPDEAMDFHPSRPHYSPGFTQLITEMSMRNLPGR